MPACGGGPEPGSLSPSSQEKPSRMMECLEESALHRVGWLNACPH